MWNARTRTALVMVAFLLLFGLSGRFVGVPGFDLIGSGDTTARWILIACWIVVDAALFVGTAILLRRPAFRAEPVDWTLPRTERRRHMQEEEERYRRSRRAVRGDPDEGFSPDGR